MQDAASATAPVLAPRGELDLVTARELGTRLAEVAGSPGDAVLDLTDVTFMDSVGLGVVLKAVNRFSRQGKCLITVLPAEGNVRRVIEFAGVADRLNAAASREEALERASMPPR